MPAIENLSGDLYVNMGNRDNTDPMNRENPRNAQYNIIDGVNRLYIYFRATEKEDYDWESIFSAVEQLNHQVELAKTAEKEYTR